MRGLAAGGLLDVAHGRIRPVLTRHNALRFRSCAKDHRPETARLATTGGTLPRGDPEGTLLRGGHPTTFPTHQEPATAEVLETARLQEKASSSRPRPCLTSSIDRGWPTGLE